MSEITDPHEQIIGCWELRANDPPMDADTRVQMEFRVGGELACGTFQRGLWHVLLMSYRVDGSTLLSGIPDVPGGPRTASAFAISPEGGLRLEFKGTTSHFERVDAFMAP